MQHRPNEDEIEDALNRVGSEAFDVVDWWEESGKFEESTLTIELEYVPPKNRVIETDDGSATPKRQAKATVQRLEDKSEDGAHIDSVIEAATEDNDFTIEAIEGAIEDLRQIGEVYEPKQDHLRST